MCEGEDMGGLSCDVVAYVFSPPQRFNVEVTPTERAMLAYLLAKVHRIDPDIIVVRAAEPPPLPPPLPPPHSSSSHHTPPPVPRATT